ncbi:MAG: hypothetical protein QNJ63_02435 [Calothrix sp. MO_192.B10]|nr:hypothetical protein [Calothrix sp. MO_192.B10]
MGHIPKKKATLEEVLASISYILFPDQMGKAPVTINSADSMGDTPLHVMAWRKERAAVKLLIEAGANVNAVGEMSETPLHVAVHQEDLEIISAMLKAGAKVDLLSEFNETPAQCAAQKGGKIAQLFKRFTGNTG